jgi:two-component sensor histidine kinase/PAS domain-containing protein
MVIVETAVSIGVDAGAAALFAWVTWRAYRLRERPNARPFLAMSGTLLVWTLLSLASELPHAWSPVSGVVSTGQVVPIVLLPGIWLVYVLGYTGRGSGLTRARIAMFVLVALPPLGAVFAFQGDPTTESIRRSLASLFGAELLLLFAIYASATFLFVRYGWRHARISKSQVGIQTGAISAPYLVGTWLGGSRIVDGVTGGLLASGVLLAFAIREYPVLTGFPKADHVARTRVVETLREAVLVIDWEGHVLDANTAAAETLLDRPVSEAIGVPVGSVVEGIPESAFEPGSTGTTALTTADGRRLFQYSVSAVEGGDGDHGEPVARTVVLRDVTDRRTREQRLAVLNRVLRHNVRNKLDVVLAHADHVEDTEHREAIQESATELADLSRKARDAEAVMTESTGSPESVDLSAVAASVAEEYRTEFPDSEITVEAPDYLTVATHRVVVHRLLAELVENAIVHTVERAPRVEIGVRTTLNGAAELVVRDNGPGIPSREREILEGDAETQLEHGLGIGLWFVNWAVLQLGGELAFEDDESWGTVVRVRLRGVDPQTGSASSEGETEAGEDVGNGHPVSSDEDAGNGHPVSSDEDDAETDNHTGP